MEAREMTDSARWREWYERFERNLDAFADEVKTLVNLDTPSARKDLTDDAATVLTRRFTDLGADVETVRFEACGPTVIGYWPGRNPSLKPVLLVGHYDTVWPEGEAARRPFTVLPNGNAIGPGTYDMKGGVAIGLQVIQHLSDRNEMPDRPIVMALNADEELGSAYSQSVWERLGREAAFALVLEPSSQRDQVWTGRKGTGIFEIEIEGVPAHAGADHERGVSAIQELAHQIHALHAITDYGAGVTVNVGTVSGGIARNVVAPHAKALVDLRAIEPGAARRAADAILELVPVQQGAVVRVSGDVRRPPMVQVASNVALFEHAAKVAEIFDMKLTHEINGGASDGNFTASVGTPTLDGLGVVGDGAHAYDEWFELTSVPLKQTLVAALLHHDVENS